MKPYDERTNSRCHGNPEHPPMTTVRVAPQEKSCLIVVISILQAGLEKYMKLHVIFLLPEEYSRPDDVLQVLTKFIG